MSFQQIEGIRIKNSGLLPRYAKRQDITETADVAKGVFYRHFASKDAFLIALWLDVQDAFIADVRAAVADVQQPQDRLTAAIGQYARTAAEQPRQVCFLLRMSSFIGEELGPPREFTRNRGAYLVSTPECNRG